MKTMRFEKRKYWYEVWDEDQPSQHISLLNNSEIQRQKRSQNLCRI